MFNWSNMGKFIVVGLIDILESLGFSGILVFVGLVLFFFFLCMFIVSGFVIWLIFVFIFVLMFMLFGFYLVFV